MNISKENLKTLWYQDSEGNDIQEGINPDEIPQNAAYYVARFPLQLSTKHYRLIKQEDVDKCKHPRKYIVPTYGWIDGIIGRECNLCRGTQTKKKWHFWPRKWDGYGCREVVTFNCTWNDEKTVLGMVNSGDFTLSEAILVYTSACERCMNVLAHKYTKGDDGYEEGGEEWKKCGTVCDFCKE